KTQVFGRFPLWRRPLINGLVAGSSPARPALFGMYITTHPAPSTARKTSCTTRIPEILFNRQSNRTTLVRSGDGGVKHNPAGFACLTEIVYASCATERVLWGKCKMGGERQLLVAIALSCLAACASPRTKVSDAFDGPAVEDMAVARVIEQRV